MVGGIFTIGADRSQREFTHTHRPDAYTCVCEMYKKIENEKILRNKNKRIKETAVTKNSRPILCPSHVLAYPWPTIFFFVQMLLVISFCRA